MRPFIFSALVVLLACEALHADNAALFKELQEARLGEVALYVSDVSNGGSRVLISQGKSADPKGGDVLRNVIWGDLPFITAYPLSSSVLTKFDGNRSLLLGVVRVLTPILPPPPQKPVLDGLTQPIPGGVYLLAYEGKLGNADTETGSMALLSLNVDHEGRPQLKPVLRVKAERATVPSAEGDVITRVLHNPLGVTLQFGPDCGSCATITISVQEPQGRKRYATYTFRLDLQVIMV